LTFDRSRYAIYFMSDDRMVGPGDARAARVALSVISAMHELAVREAFPRLAATDVAAMRQANRRLADALRADDVDAAIAADDQFHALPVAVSGNAALRTVLEQFAPPLGRAERLRFSVPGGRDPVAQHDRILELSEAGDLDAAVAATRAEWQSLEPLLGLAGGRPDPA
jgi:DNA-binding GntR family transcriptional regulator